MAGKILPHGKVGVYYYLKKENKKFMEYLTKVGDYKRESRALDHVIEFFKEKSNFMSPKK